MANHRRVSEDQEKEVRRLFTEGHAVSIIARELGVPYKTLLETAKRMGLPVHRHGRRSGLSQETIDSIVHQYKTLNYGTKYIASLHGITDGTVARYLREQGVELRSAGFQTGEEHHAWKGGRIVSSTGYVLVQLTPEHPYYEMAQIKTSGPNRYCLEHRLVMAQKLGRLLRDDETVHHKDGNKQNNGSRNLQLRQGNHGKGACFRCRACGSYDVEAAELGVN